MRLIDADAMHKFVEDKAAEGKDGWANGVCYEWAWTLTAVDMQPTIEAEPVKHGRWIEQEAPNMDTYYDCSACGESFVFIEGSPADNLYTYCPNCGAKMDGGYDNE